MKKICILLLLFISTVNAKTISLCSENTRVFPWILDEEQGIDFIHLRLVEKHLKLKFELVKLPWQRCQLEAKSGNFDGIFAASYNTERAEWGVYPFEVNQSVVENKYRLHTDSFFLFSQKHSNVKIINDKIIGINQEPIGVQIGYSVGKTLVDKGYNVKYPATTSLDLIKEYNAGNFKYIVLQDYESELLFAEKPSLRKELERIYPAIKISDQYLLFTKKFFKENESISRKIWKEIDKVRNTREYKEYFRKVLNK